LRDNDIVSKIIAGGTERNEGDYAPAICFSRSAVNVNISSEELTTYNKYVANIMQHYIVGETRHEQHASVYDANLTEHISFDKHPTEHGLESLDVWVTEVINSDHPAYNKKAAQVAITEQIQGLLDRKTFDLVLRNELPGDANIIGSRIVLEFKTYKTSEEFVKAILVIQGFSDRDGSSIVTDAPSVSHFSVCVLLSISVLMKWKVWSKDALQAFSQSESNISRNVYARLPRELRAHFFGYVWKLLKPLYGLKESGSYWIHTYIKTVVNKLKMVATFLDPCIDTKITQQMASRPYSLTIRHSLVRRTSLKPRQKCINSLSWDPQAF
jgi:Reverse transcriptase (RNA-dependent DNA polymerase)